MRQSIQWKKQREVQRSIISCNILCEREKCVSNFWKGIRSYTVILGRIRSDSGQSRSHLNWQRRISETPFRISGDDVPFTLSWSYEPLVGSIIVEKASEKEVEHLLDYMLDVCHDDRMLNLFKKVCRRYHALYPEMIASEILAYKEWYED